MRASAGASDVASIEHWCCYAGGCGGGCGGGGGGGRDGWETFVVFPVLGSN